MSKKHALIMIACCLIPLIGFVLVSVFKVPLNSVLLFGMVLVCPIMHLWMMKYMIHGEEQDHSNAFDHTLHQASSQISKPGEVSE